MGFADFFKPAEKEIDIRLFGYMQLKLYDDEATPRNVLAEILKRKDDIGLTCKIELRKAKSKDVYPYWLVFYVQRPSEWDKIVLFMGDGDLDKGRAFINARDYDDGFGMEKRKAIMKDSKLILMESV